MTISTNAGLGIAAEASFFSRNANYIRATFTDNFYDAADPLGGGDRLGISEIRFTGDDGGSLEAPEPSMLAPCTLALGALVSRRRK